MVAERSAGVFGVIGLVPENCTSCDICVRECPTWCISLDAHTEQIADERRPRTIKVLDDFTIDFGLCMYCGICVDVCPSDALYWAADFDPSAPDRSELEQAIAQLKEWPRPSGS
jgi:NADH-quinone oxidoreductase subunit I